MADKAREVTITGCLSKGADGKFMLTNARIDSPTAESTATAGGSTTTTGTATAAGTSAGTTPTEGAMKQSPAVSWVLAGGTDFDKHVGHKIQVTGQTAWDSMDHGRATETTASAAAGTVGTSGTTTTAATEEQRKDMRADQPRLDVQSLKMLAPSCS